jgi:hypothetical protein
LSCALAKMIEIRGTLVEQRLGFPLMDERVACDAQIVDVVSP